MSRVSLLLLKFCLLGGTTFASSGFLDQNRPFADYRFETNNGGRSRELYEPTRPSHRRDLSRSYSSSRLSHRPGLYEPTRPRRKSATRNWRSDTNSYPRNDYDYSHQQHLYEPTRPTASAYRNSLGVYEPQRPSHSQLGSTPSGWRTEDYSAPSYFTPLSVNTGYEQAMSRYNSYERLQSGYENYQEARKWYRPIAKFGKMLFKPVSFTFKLSKKAASKLALGWAPPF